MADFVVFADFSYHNFNGTCRFLDMEKGKIFTGRCETLFLGEQDGD